MRIAGWSVCAFALLAAVFSAAEAQAPKAAASSRTSGETLVYESNFAAGVGSEWSSDRRENASGIKRTFLGRFENAGPTLSLHNLPPHKFLRMTLDVYMLMSFPSSSSSWSLRTGGGQLLTRLTFTGSDATAGSLTLIDELNPKPAARDKLSLNSRGHEPSYNTIHQVSVVLPHEAPEANLVCEGQGAGGSIIAWGLDNVRVEAIAAVVDLTKSQMEVLWARLGEPAPVGIDAQWSLVAAGDAAAKFIAAKHASGGVDAAMVAKLVTQLDADEFANRKAASDALAKIGPVAAPLLREALKTTESEEVRARLQELLDREAVQVQAKEMTSLRSVRVLSVLGSPTAVEALKTVEASAGANPRLAAIARAAMMQAAAALACGPNAPKAESLELAGGVLMPLVLVPAGKFTMGSPADEAQREADEGPQHEVTLSKPFYISASRLTGAQYCAVMGHLPGQTPDGVSGQATDVKLSPSVVTAIEQAAARMPAELTWQQAADFCRRLSLQTGLRAHLPTEAQWEYAARAGTPERWSFGDKPALQHDFDVMPLPNPWGLYGMHGGLDWCADWYAKDYYAFSPAVDPAGPAATDRKVARGGRSAQRRPLNADRQPLSTAGIRVVIDVPPGGGLQYVRPLTARDFAVSDETGAVCGTVKVPLRNATSQPAAQAAVWTLPANCRWKVSPLRAEANLAAGESREVSFALAFEGNPAEVQPHPVVSVGLAADANALVQPPVNIDARAVALARQPRALCPAVAKGPKIEDGLKDPAWAKASALPGFVNATGDANAAQPTEVRLLHDANALYLSIRCFEDKKILANMRPSVTQHDGAVYNEDSVEIFVDPNAGAMTYFQFVANSIGTQYEGEVWDANWNGPWQVHADKDATSWTLTVAIPWKTLGVKDAATGQKIAFNVIRTRHMYGMERSMWSPVHSNNNHVPERMGRVIMTPAAEPPTSAPAK